MLSRKLINFIKKTEEQSETINSVLSFLKTHNNIFYMSELYYSLGADFKKTSKVLEDLLSTSVISYLSTECPHCGHPCKSESNFICKDCQEGVDIIEAKIFSIHDNTLFENIQDSVINEKSAHFFHDILYKQKQGIFYVIYDINHSQQEQRKENYAKKKDELIVNITKEIVLPSIREQKMVLGQGGDDIKIIFASFLGAYTLFKRLAEKMRQREVEFTIKAIINYVSLRELELVDSHCFNRDVMGIWDLHSIEVTDTHRFFSNTSISEEYKKNIITLCIPEKILSKEEAEKHRKLSFQETQQVTSEKDKASKKSLEEINIYALF